MSQNIDLKKLERKAYLSYHQDGLLDISAGLLIAGLGVSFAIEMPWLIGAWFAVGLPVWNSAKRLVTAPRVGMIRFGTARKTRQGLALATIASMLILSSIAGAAFAVAFDSLSPEVMDSIVDKLDLALGVFGALLLAVVAMFVGLNRFYGYAALTLTIFVVGHLLNLSGVVPLIVTGLLMLLCGLFMLNRFLHYYPILAITDGESSNDAR